MAEGNVNAAIQDILIGNQVDLVKLEGTMRAQVLDVLKELEADLIKRLAKADPTLPALTKFQQQRLTRLLQQTQSVIGSSFATARRLTNAELIKLAEIESALAGGSIQTAIGTELGIPSLNRQTLQAIVNDGLIQGAPSREWWAKQAANTQAAFSQQMRLGVLAGENVGQLANRVRGLMNIPKHQAEALARTSTISVSNLARLRTYQENAHLIKAIKWLSTLDSRTTDICKGLDGLMWDPVTFEPIGHSTSFPGPTAHWNCRSTQIPITRSYEELAKIKTDQAKSTALKLQAAGAGTRSALNGQVPASIGYEQWLLLKETAEPGFALRTKALTPGKYSLWKQGKLDFKELIDQSANPITVKELQQQLKGIIPTTATPASALAAQEAAVTASGKFDSKASQAAAKGKTAQEAMEARVAQAKEMADVNAKNEALDTLKSYSSKQTAPSTYHYNAFQAAKKKKGYTKALINDDPVGFLAQVDSVAAKKKLSVDLAHYKQSVLKGKKPSPAAQAAFDTLPDEAAKDVLDAIKIKQAEQAAVAAAEKAAAEKTAAIAKANEEAAEAISTIVANPKGQTKLAKALQDGLKDPDINSLSPSRQLALAKEKAAATQAQAEKSAVLSGYKKKLLSGEKPTPKQAQIVTGLSKEELQTLGAQIDALEDNLQGYKNAIAGGINPSKAQEKASKFLTPKGKKKLAEELKELKKTAPPTAPEAQAAAIKVAKPEANPTLDMAKWKQTGKKPGGSVPGAIYTDEAGVEWIVKYTASEDVARNEVLTSKLYQLVGVQAPDVRLVVLDSRAGARAGNLGVASRLIDDVKTVKTAAQMKKVDGVYDGFAADAWLADWDVVGLNFDNIVIGPTGKAIRIDVGSGLRYRAQGGAKGANFGEVVGELDSLRDPAINREAAAVFGKIPEAKIEAGVAQILRVTDDQIDELVDLYYPNMTTGRQLKALIKARREDLRKKFPQLTATKARPAPRRTGEVVGKDEYERINNARATGYQIRADIDEIEDQAILIHHETTGKAANTMATLKVRDQGLKKLEAQVNKNQSTVQGIDHNAVDNSFLTAIKGISYRTAQGNPLEVKDIERVQVARAEYRKALDRMESLVEQGVYTNRAFNDFEEHYDQWIIALDRAVQAGAGKAAKWTPPPGQFHSVRGLPKPKQPGKKSNVVQWKRGQADFQAAEFKKGFATKTKKSAYRHHEAPWEATLDDGTEIRFWDSSAQGAMKGRVEIRAPGQTQAAANRVATALDEVAQINTSLPTAADEELLYLTQIAYARVKDWKAFQRVVKAAKTQDEKIAKAKEWLNGKIGRDITASPNYNPAGARAAFESGKLNRYRPDLLDDPKWASFENDHLLHHSLWEFKDDNGIRINRVDLINRILSSGGRMTPTTDKLRLGIIPKGMSPTPDLKSGGADYFFTRIQPKGLARGQPGLTFKVRQAARTDAISYANDHYGKTSTEAFILKNRVSDLPGYRRIAGRHGNETILKGGVSLFEDLDAIVVKDAAEKKRMISMIKNEHGLLRWPDGRTLDEVVQIRASDY